MEINNSYSQNLYESKTSSTKTVDEVGVLSIFDKLVDKSKATDTKASAYYESSNIPLTSNVTYEKPAPVKWEDQLIYFNLQYSFDPSNIIAEENMKNNDPLSYEWRMQYKIATNGNKYDDAPEFEAFVKKWMAKGETEDQALGRAQAYAYAGLLDYGKEKAIRIGETLPYGDTKQHGFHLINNEPLKNAVIKTLDSLNGGDASTLIASIFQNYPENANTPISFQELLQNFGVKLEDLKKLNPEEHKDDKFTFTGDINLKDGADSKDYNNFILDTLVKFFKDRIQRFDYFVENTPPGITNNLDALKDSTNSLIDNLKKEFDTYNSKNYDNKSTSDSIN